MGLEVINAVFRHFFVSFVLGNAENDDLRKTDFVNGGYSSPQFCLSQSPFFSEFGISNDVYRSVPPFNANQINHLTFFDWAYRISGFCLFWLVEKVGIDFILHRNDFENRSRAEVIRTARNRLCRLSYPYRLQSNVSVNPPGMNSSETNNRCLCLAVEVNGIGSREANHRKLFSLRYPVNPIKSERQEA